MHSKFNEEIQDWFYVKDFVYSCITVFGLVLLSPGIAYLIWIG